MLNAVKSFFLIIFSMLSAHASSHLPKLNGSDITQQMLNNKEIVLNSLWDSEEYIDATYEISDIEDLNSTDYVMLYILINRGNLIVRNSFYEHKLQSLIRNNQLTQNDWLKLYIAFANQKSHSAYKLLVQKAGTKNLIREIDRIINATDHPSVEEIKEIINYRKDPNSLSTLELDDEDALRTFVFCRSDRLYPCLMLIQDKRGDWARDIDGSIFARPVLAKSSRGLPAHVTNGNTPRGVHTIDSVMPLADQFSLFGAYRRVKLDFLSGAQQEQATKLMLPESQHGRYWWRYNSLARDNGRSLFRIHGTGRPNYDDTTTYFPHRPSAGCITTREGAYPSMTYTDQRSVLDAMMRSLDLVEKYENEELINGFLFLIELNTKASAVKMDELVELGIISDESPAQEPDQSSDDVIVPDQDVVENVQDQSSSNKSRDAIQEQVVESELGLLARFRLWLSSLFS
jgi:hypothetical protein